MKYDLILTGKFKKGLKLARKRGLDINLLEEVIDKLQKDIPLEAKYKDYDLKGLGKAFENATSSQIGCSFI